MLRLLQVFVILSILSTDVQGYTFIECKYQSDELFSADKIVEELRGNKFISDLDSFYAYQNQLYCSGIYHGNLEAQAHAINQMAFFHYSKSEYKIATELLIKGQKLSTKTNYLNGLVDYECYMGLVWQALGKTKRALKHFRNLLKLGEQHDHQRWRADACINIGSSLINSGNYEEAKNYIQKGLTILEDTEVSETVGWAYSHLGNIASLEGDKKLALQYFDKAKEVWSEHNVKRGLAYVYSSLGELLKEDNPKQTIVYLKQALKYAKESNFKSQETVAKLRLGKAYATINVDSAFYYLVDIVNNTSTEITPIVKEDASRDLLEIVKKQGEEKKYKIYSERYLDILKELVAFQNEEHRNWMRLEEDVLSLEQENLYQRELVQHAADKNKLLVRFFLVLALLTVLLGWCYYRHSKLNKKVAITNDQLTKNIKLLEEQSKRLESQNKELDRQKNTLASQLASKLTIVREIQLKNSTLHKKISNTDMDQEAKQKLLEIVENTRNTDLLTNLDQELQEVNNSLFAQLLEKHPNLTANNLKLVSYVKMHLTNKEIANLFYISSDSVKVAKNRLKKKLDLDSNQSLDQYIHSFD